MDKVGVIKIGYRMLPSRSRSMFTFVNFFFRSIRVLPVDLSPPLRPFMRSLSFLYLPSYDL